MTREEIIEQIENTILLIKQNGKDWWDERDFPILEAAIKAMKKEPCEDCISRQAVLDKIETVCFSKAWSKFRADNGSKGTRDYIINYIKRLPPVQLEPKTDVLDKIRAEIENDWQLKKYPSSPFSCGLRRAIEVIDKYKAESEVEG